MEGKNTVFACFGKRHATYPPLAKRSPTPSLSLHADFAGACITLFLRLNLSLSFPFLCVGQPGIKKFITLSVCQRSMSVVVGVFRSFYLAI